MNRFQHRPTTASRSTASAATASAALAGILVLGFGVLPASARQDAGPAADPDQGGTSTSCTLQRVGDQLVACDNLTGNGVAAPGWIQQR